MEIEQQPSAENPRKRTVDADNKGQSIPDPKRPRININSAKKVAILSYIVESGFAVYEKLEVCREIANITIGHQVMSIMQGSHNIMRKMANARASTHPSLDLIGHQVMSIMQGSHNIMRKMANARASTHPSLDLNASITSLAGSKNILYKDVVAIMRPIAEKYGLAYTAPNRNDNDHWYGIANPIFNILSAFKMRFDEIRLGVSKMPVAKRGNTTDYVDVTQYGMTPAHHILLEGSTYKPERRSAMAQTMGPMTALIASYKSKDPYRNKWVEAVKRDLAHIPHSLHLCNAIYGKRSEEIAPAMSAIADCILIAGSRNAQRAFFPLNFLLNALMSKENAETCGLKDHVPLTPGEVDFSGAGMRRLYKMCVKYRWKIETGLDDVEAAEVVYHAIFGTQNEDLGVLQQVTSFRSPWKLRSQIAGKFRSQGKRKVDFALLTESSYQVRSKQVFAGVRTVKYILYSFYKHMDSDNNNMMQGGLTLPALTAFYRQLKSDLMGKKDDHKTHGTVEWRFHRPMSQAWGCVHGRGEGDGQIFLWKMRLKPI